MKQFTFETLDGSEIEPKEYKGLKQALYDVQKSIKGHYVRVQYKNKKGNDIDRWVKIPIGRKKKGFQVPEPYLTTKMKRALEKKQEAKGMRR
tara:strand:- start:1019 stop:1294 length:276 start_codon:yes stop_codon:yes gene_type:complete